MARGRRPKLDTKEELLAYLAANTDTELPFNEDVWNRAVYLITNKEQTFKEIRVTEHDGKTRTKKVPNGATSPVGKYFQMMALPNVSKPTVEQEKALMSSNDDEFEFEFDDEEKVSQVTEWVSMFFVGITDREEKKHVIQRLADYYDNYELNEGADKFQAVKAVLDELEMRRLIQLRLKGKDVEATLEKVQKSYLALLDSMKAMKKQRGVGEEQGKNKLTLWVDDLERAGEFTVKKDETYTSDDIDKLLNEIEQSMRKVYYEG